MPGFQWPHVTSAWGQENNGWSWAQAGPPKPKTLNRWTLKKKTSRKEKLKDNHLAPPQLRVENNISAYFLNYMLRLIMAWDWSVCTKFTPAVWSAVAWKIFKWLPSQGARSDEERNEWEILAFNCLTPKVTYISSAHCLLAWCSHLAPTYLQGRLGNNKGELGMFSEYYFCLMI